MFFLYPVLLTLRDVVDTVEVLGPHVVVHVLFGCPHHLQRGHLKMQLARFSGMTTIQKFFITF